MDSKAIAGLVNQLIAGRNLCKQAIVANEQIITVPAVPATAAAGATPGNPGKPESKRSTGQLANAANNFFVTATNLIGHLKNIAPDAADNIAALEKALNAPVPPVKAPTPNATASTPVTGTPAPAQK
jgi:hypothetical protein